MVNQLGIEFEQGRVEFRPGERIRGRVHWSLLQPAEKVELRLFWFTRGKGDQDVEIVQKIEYAPPSLDERRDFELELPLFPYSFSGKLISLIWALELVLLPSCEACRSEVSVSPNGREVDLYANCPESSAEPEVL